MRFIVLLAVFFLVSCNNKSDGPDISEIKANIKLERFERDFFSLDSNNLLPGLNRLNEKYPGLTPLFIQNILGLDSATILPGVKRFINLSQFLYDSVNNVFRNTDGIKKDFETAFRYIKYYFPEYKERNVFTLIGPVDLLAKTTNGYSPDFLGPDFIGISLQFYLGKDFSLYKDPYFIDNVTPQYRSRRFSKEYIIGDAMQLIVDDLFPDRSNGKPLIEQMIERGKQWWLLDKFLPGVPDSVKTGYTRQQLEWCSENEGLIWSYFVKNEDIYSINPATIQNYIGESPFTQGFSQELSPGNLGQWIGWRIVSKFAGKNPGMKPEDIMRTEARKILDEARYKPK